jgi:hypothetical protein
MRDDANERDRQKPEDVGIGYGFEAFSRASATSIRACSTVVRSPWLGTARSLRCAVSQAVQGTAKPVTDETPFTSSPAKGDRRCSGLAALRDNLLRLDEKVADIIPEFGTNGKK